MLQSDQCSRRMIIASEFVSKGVLPDKHDNDGLVVAEAALHDCKMLVTYRYFVDFIRRLTARFAISLVT